MLKITFSIFIFMLTSLLHAADISTQKSTYSINQDITVSVSSMQGEYKDWVGIYPAGSNNSWENVVSWEWTNNVTDGEITLDGIANAGTYEARAFFRNSYQVEAKVAFTVGDSTTISSQKPSYNTNESITVSVANMQGEYKDWIGIYPVGSNNSWANVVSWKWTDNVTNGQIILDGIANAGSYEARAFFRNSYQVEAKVAFTVGNQVENFGEKGNHNIATIALPNNTFVHYPTDLNGASAPVVIVAQGGRTKYSDNRFMTVMNFIASHGYYAVFTDVSSYGRTPKNLVKNYTQAITTLRNQGKNVDTSMIGVFGLSTGGGVAFGLLHEIKKYNGYAHNQNFIFSNDPERAWGMTEQDLINLSDNRTNMVIMQNGIKGNNKKRGDFGGNFTTDALFPLSIYRLIKQNNPQRTDYQVFEGAGTRGHLYVQDNSVEGGVVGQNYEQMEGILKPFGALMELTFKGNESARKIALHSGSDNPVSDGIQKVKDKAFYAYKCLKINNGIDYCADDNNRNNIPDL